MTLLRAPVVAQCSHENQPVLTPNCLLLRLMQQDTTCVIHVSRVRMAAPAATATTRRGLGLALTTAGCGFFGTLAATAYYYRPHPEPEDGEITTERPTFSTPTPLCDIADQPDTLLMHITRTVTIGLVAAAGRVSLFGLNDFRVREDGKHARLVDLVQHREPGTPLITVSNHTTTLDDPALFGVLMPWTVNARPDKVRWSACTQDICFSSAWRSAFFGAGKVMPIHRGGGVDQRLLQDLSRRVAAGEWCHVFPEGKCYQQHTLGGREGEEAKKMGRLKWGVGKLIARAPHRPIVVPIYHIGMDRWFPINQVTKRLERSVPATGQRMSMIVGEPIYLDDLLDEYEKKVRDHEERRARARALTGDKGVNVVREKWASTDVEKEVYSKITRRIEESLLKLEKEARAHHVLVFGQDSLAPPPPEATEGR